MTEVYGPFGLRVVEVYDPTGRAYAVTARDGARVGRLHVKRYLMPIGLPVRYDDSAFVSMTFPERRPDYTADELARIAAAEAKRARRGNSLVAA